MGLIEKIDNFNKSSKGKVVKSIISLFCCMIMVVTVCLAYAWFAKNRDVGSNGMGVTTKYEAVVVEFNSYHIDNIDTQNVAKGSQYTNQSGETVLDVDLLAYDMTFTSTNQFAPVVVRLKISGIPEDKMPAANETKYVSLVINRNTSLSFNTSSELDGYFSSVGQIGCYTNTTLGLNASNDDIYSAIIAQYRADQNVMRFISESNSTYSKVALLDKSLAYTSANFVTDANNEKCLLLYMCFDYNSVYAQAYAQQESESLENITSLEHRFDILNDITLVSVDFN